MPPATRSWIDLGSGAGFPGLVAAIVMAGGAPSPRATPTSPQAPSAWGEGRGEEQEHAPTSLGQGQDDWRPTARSLLLPLALALSPLAGRGNPSQSASR
jgi:hypothetical protein